MKSYTKHTLNDSGMTTVSYMLATGLSMIVLTWFCAFVVMSYSRAAIRGASERATRAAVIEYSVTNDVDRARQKCTEVYLQDLDSALSSNVRTGFSHSCFLLDGSVSLETRGSFSSVSSFLPSTDFVETSTRDLETKP